MQETSIDHQLFSRSKKQKAQVFQEQINIVMVELMKPFHSFASSPKEGKNDFLSRAEDRLSSWLAGQFPSTFLREPSAPHNVVDACFFARQLAA